MPQPSESVLVPLSVKTAASTDKAVLKLVVFGTGELFMGDEAILILVLVLEDFFNHFILE